MIIELLALLLFILVFPFRDDVHARVLWLLQVIHVIYVHAGVISIVWRSGALSAKALTGFKPVLVLGKNVHLVFVSAADAANSNAESSCESDGYYADDITYILGFFFIYLLQFL